MAGNEMTASFGADPGEPAMRVVRNDVRTDEQTNGQANEQANGQANERRSDADGQADGGFGVLGVTGLPCAGKSLAARLIAAGDVTGLPGEWIQADGLGREILERPEMLEALARRFGGGTVAAGDPVETRRRVAERVFRNPEDLAWLEGMVHPLVAEETACRIRAIDGSRPVILEAALLFAAGMEECCDGILLIEAGFGTRLARAAKRGWNEEELRRRDGRIAPLFAAEALASVRARLRLVQNDADDGCLAERLRTTLEGWFFEVAKKGLPGKRLF